MSLWLLFATSQEKIGDNTGFYSGENPKSGVSSLGTRVCWLLREAGLVVGQKRRNGKGLRKSPLGL